MSFKRIFLISLFVKLVVAALFPLSFDEAYYWIWSHHLQLSYFDHPPMVAWLLWLGQGLEDIGSMVRWPGVILGHFSLLLWFLILKPYISEKNIQYFCWAFLLNPFLGFGSIIITPDLPVLLFWTASIYCFNKALNEKSAKWYIALGATLGLGFCAKYHIVLFVPAAIIYLAFEKKIKEVQWRWIPLTAIVGLLFCLPVLIWNFQNDFASFKFQIDHGLHGRSYEIDWTLGYIGSQLLLVSPFVIWALTKATTPSAIQSLKYFAIFPLLFFLFTSTRGHVEANWPIMAYGAAIALLCFTNESFQLFKKHTYYWFGVYSILFTLIALRPSSIDFEKINEPFVFSGLKEEIKDFTPLFGTTYQMASSLWFETKQPVYKIKGLGRFDYFDQFPVEPLGLKKFYVMKYANQTLPAWMNEPPYSTQKLKEFSHSVELVQVSQP